MPEELLPNQNNVTTPTQPQMAASQPTVINNKPAPQGKSPILKWILIGVTSVLILAGIVGAYILGTQKSNNSTATISPAITPASTATTDWKKYNLSSVNLEFSLPPELAGELTEEIQDSKDLPANAAKGKVYCAYINKNDMSFIPKANAGGSLACASDKALFTIGGASPDLEVGRSGAYSDFQGFIKNGENYEVRFVANKTFPTTDVKTSYFKNENGVEILKIYGQPAEGMSVWPNEGKILVIVNTNNPTFRGISFEVDTSKITEDNLDQILSTFNFSNTTSDSSTDTSNWKTYNSTCDLNVKYPNTWSADNVFFASDDDVCVNIGDENFKTSTTDATEGFYINIHKRKFDKSKFSSLEAYVKNYELGENIPLNYVAKTYGNYSGFEFDPPGLGNNRSFMFIKNDYLYEINWIISTSKNYKDIIPNIISSINLIN